MIIVGSRQTPLRQPDQAVNGLFIALFILAYIGIWVALLTPNAITLALRVADLAPKTKTSSLAMVALCGAICSGISNPMFGHLSDISLSRFGRRRSFMLGGMVAGMFALLVLATAPNLWVVGLGWCLTVISMNAALAALVAILPERIPDRLRSIASVFMGMSTQIGIVTGTGLIQLTSTTEIGMFMLPGVVGLAFVVVFVVYLKELPRTRDELPSFDWRNLVKSLWINPIKYPDFGFVWSGRFLLWISTNSLSLYKTNYLIDRFGYTTQGAKQVLLPSMAILATSIICGSSLAGFLSARTGKRKPFVMAASLIFTVGISIIAFASTVQMFFVGMAICGFGQGAYMGVDYALVAAVLPDKETQAGKGMGVFNLSSTVAQSFAPVLAPVLLRLGGPDPIGGPANYATFFLCAGFFAALGAVLILFVERESDSPPAPAPGGKPKTVVPDARRPAGSART